jgi:hypothetical protein
MRVLQQAKEYVERQERRYKSQGRHPMQAVGEDARREMDEDATEE